MAGNRQQGGKRRRTTGKLAIVSLLGVIFAMLFIILPHSHPQPMEQAQSELQRFVDSINAEYVAEYERSDGTIVAEHGRTKANETTADNWSTFPNVNPITHEIGRKGSRTYSVEKLPTYLRTIAIERIDELLKEAEISIDRDHRIISGPAEFWEDCSIHPVPSVRFDSLTDEEQEAVSVQINEILRPHGILCTPSGRVTATTEFWKDGQ